MSRKKGQDIKTIEIVSELYLLSKVLSICGFSDNEIIKILKEKEEEMKKGE